MGFVFAYRFCGFRGSAHRVCCIALTEALEDDDLSQRSQEDSGVAGSAGASKASGGTGSGTSAKRACSAARLLVKRVDLRMR